MKIVRILLPLMAVLTLSGCYAQFRAPAPDLSVPLTAEKAQKAGDASCQQILWAFAFGDCSVKASMDNGSIERLHHVDSEVQVVLWGVFSQYTVRTWGE